MIFILALRNLLRHKKNTILLMLLIAFITMVFFMGNSFLSQSERGLRRTYADNLTADLMIQKTQDISMNLFGANTPVIDEFFVIPALPAYDEIRRILDKEGVSQAAAIVSGKAVMDVAGYREPVALLGVEAPDYFDIFPGIELVKGEFLSPNTSGVMMPEEMVKSIEISRDTTLKVGDPVKFTTAYGNGFRIREVPLTGIYRYKNPGPYMEQIALTDPQTLRALSSVLNVATEKVEVSDDALALLDSSMDDLFGSADLFGGSEDAFTIEDLETDLQNRDKTKSEQVSGDWNFLLVRAEEGQKPSRLIKHLNSILNSYGVSVVNWRTAAGNTAMTVFYIQFFFYGGILLISLAGIISIVNIMLIAVFKRTREIGTLRAIGASDGVVAGMILLENLILSLIAGLLGLLFTQWGTNYLNSLNIPFNNNLLASLFGASTFQIELTSIEAIKSLTLAVGLGVCSAIYPGFLAMKINPIEAVRRG